MRSHIIYNGRLHSADTPIVSAEDGLTLYGLGVFETLLAQKGRVLLAEEHILRLRDAARCLQLTCPSDSELSEAMRSVLTANQLTEADAARVRITLSSPRDGASSWWVVATTPPLHPPLARVMSGPFVRNEKSPLAGMKTTHCGDSFLAHQKAKDLGVDELIFGNTQGDLCEGTWSNIFVKIAGQWFTPPVGSGCLPGIIRALALDLSRDLSLPISESSPSMRELERVESAFFSSSLRKIQPISEMDGRELEITEEIADLADLLEHRLCSKRG